jgi:hypothetical protein
MVNYLFKIEESDLERLRQQSEATGVSVSHQIRTAIKGMFNSSIPCGIVMSGQIVSGFLMVMR